MSPQVPHILVSPTDVGTVTIAPPTFLERWGIVFLACAGAWVLIISTWLLVYFLHTQPPLPGTANLSPDQARDTLNLHKQLLDQWRDSFTFIFDLTVTKTALPVVTLLLGYLFGRSRP